MNTTEELHTQLPALLKKIGKFDVELKKESIHVVHGGAFVGIHPKKSYLRVNLVLDKRETSPRADKVEKVSANRFHHLFKIESKQQMNKSFARLLKEAYNLTNLNK
jgi:Domain of unknown function (DUF5655)